MDIYAHVRLFLAIFILFLWAQAAASFEVV